MVTRNVHGYAMTQTDKKNGIANYLNRQRDPTVYLTQETWQKDNETIELDNCLFLSNGNPQDTRKNGGVGIVLSPQATKAWKKAGQPEPIRPDPVTSATRTMAINLHFKDARQKTVKTLFITTYFPTTSYDVIEFEKTLDQLQVLINQCPENAMLIIGGDFNASIGVTPKKEKYSTSATGQFGNPHRNQNGDTL